MSSVVVAHRVFIASPSEVQRERTAAVQIIERWNDEHGDSRGVILRPVLWERHVTPELGDRPQAIINRRLLKDADVLVAIFWTRLGSPTGRANSGTIEEIEEFCSSGKPTLLYFSRRPVRPHEMNAEQWSLLREMEARYSARGLVCHFGTRPQFEHDFRRHLTEVVSQNIKQLRIAMSGTPS